MPPEEAPANPLDNAVAEVVSDQQPAPAAPDPGDDFVSRIMAGLEEEAPPAAGDEPNPTEDEPNPTKEEEPKPKSEDPLDQIDEEYPELDDKATPQAKAKWGELKTELKQERHAVRELRRELEALKSKDLFDPTEVESLKKQVEEATKELAVHRIEVTKEYKEAITTPLDAIGDAAAVVARRYEINEDKLLDALAERDEAKQNKMLEDLVSGMNSRDQGKVYQMADDTLMILKKAEAMKANAHEALQELEVRQKGAAEKEAAERKRVMTSEVERVWSVLEDKLPFLPLADGESKSEILDALKQDTLATPDISTATPGVQAYSVAAGVALPRLIKQLRAVIAERDTYKARVAEINESSPARARQEPTQPAPAKREGGFLDAVLSQLQG